MYVTLQQRCEKTKEWDQEWQLSVLTAEYDDPAVSAAGLSVVTEANMVTLHARWLPTFL